MAANIRCIMRAKAPYGQGITKMKVKLTPEQSSTPSLMPETESVYLRRATEGTGELMELVGGTVAWGQMMPNNSVMSYSQNPYTFASGTVFNANHKILFRTKRDMAEANLVIYLFHRPVGSSTNQSVEMCTFSGSALSAQKIVNLTFGGTANGTANAQGGFWLYATFANSPNTTVSELEWYDLTQMLGTTIADYVYSLEQATAGSGIQWLKDYDLIDDEYHAYNAGSLESVNVSAHITRGRNLLPKMVDGTYEGNGVKAVVSNGVATLSGTTTTSGNALIIPLTEEVTVPTEQCYLHFLNSDVMARAAPSFELSTDVGNTSVSFSFSPANRIVAVNQNRLGVKWDRVRFYLASGVTLSGTFSPMLCYSNEAMDYAEAWSETYASDSSVILRGMLKTDEDGNLYYDGDTYEWDGTVTRNYGTRAYQAGDESLTDAITDGTNTVYKLTTPTTESADPFTAVQTVEDGGTEEFVTTNNVPVGVVGRFANAVPMEGVDSFTVTADDGTTHTYPVTLSEEIYRGYVDMLTGEAVSDMASIAEYNGETIGEPWLSSLDVYSSGATPTKGAQVVYPITPEEVTATITGDPSELSGVVSATSTEGTVDWSELSEIGIKCIMKRKNPFQ